MSDLKTSIAHVGQPYIDEPLWILPKQRTPVEASVAAAFGRTGPPPITVGYERVRLRWMKPDGKGGLIPK